MFSELLSRSKMFNAHKEMAEYHDSHVRLGSVKRSDLASKRDANLQRLKQGLEKIKKPSTFTDRDQGSYAMRTMIQSRHSDYDLDEAVIFAKEDLPASPLEARKRIEEALREGGGNFSKEPEARTNAVTAWYQDGYHVDLAVYRKSTDFWGNEVIEHAGPEWTNRDPMAVNDWFKREVAEQSPTDGTVPRGQLRRIVRLLKSFAESRESWSLPGGLILSTLAAERYRPNKDRDDQALYDTMVAIRDRLEWNTTVASPIGGPDLTEKTKHRSQVKRLLKRLKFVLKKLDPLFESDCSPAKAYRSWNWVFKHDYWGKRPEEKAAGEQELNEEAPLALKIDVGVAKMRRGKIRWPC